MEAVRIRGGVARLPATSAVALPHPIGRHRAPSAQFLVCYSRRAYRVRGPVNAIRQRDVGRRASLEWPGPGSHLGLADARHLLHGAQMRCPEEAGETAEE